jgi:hypothetical protein
MIGKRNSFQSSIFLEAIFMVKRTLAALIGTLMFLSSLSLRAQDRSTEFDGNWKLSMECPSYSHVSNHWAGWSLSFPITIKDGMVDGKLGPELGLGGNHHVHGPIAPNGVAKLTYDGTSGNFTSGMRGQKFFAIGSPLQYPLEAKFSGNTGEGLRRASLVSCKVRFDRL